MVRFAQERILLIGDRGRQVEPALAQAIPAAQVTRVDDYFEGIAELSAHDYSAVVASAEPIEHRPEAAIRTLRELAGDGRLILFCPPKLEPVSRRMTEFGCDDYLISPASVAEVQQIFGTPVMRIAPATDEGAAPEMPPEIATITPSPLQSVPLADLALDALMHHPGAATTALAKAVDQVILPDYQFAHVAAGKDAPWPADGELTLSHPVRTGQEGPAHLYLRLPDASQQSVGRHFLAQAAATFARVTTLQERHNRLTKLAITDQLTGVFNRRYFEHFFAGILEKAKQKRFQVTLLLFDIDNFKKYNDECGHGVGDDILRETAALMRRCCREHDFVARIGGDEFAVVFWEKEPPRQPKDPARPVTPGRVPQEPLQILQRFRRAIAAKEFAGLGPTGRGSLTISGGLASFPWDGHNVEEMVAAADRALTFGAKRGGKNSIHLVGGDEQQFEGA